MISNWEKRKKVLNQILKYKELIEYTHIQGETEIKSSMDILKEWNHLNEQVVQFYETQRKAKVEKIIWITTFKEVLNRSDNTLDTTK